MSGCGFARGVKRKAKSSHKGDRPDKHSEKKEASVSLFCIDFSHISCHLSFIISNHIALLMGKLLHFFVIFFLR